MRKEKKTTIIIPLKGNKRELKNKKFELVNIVKPKFKNTQSACSIKTNVMKGYKFSFLLSIYIWEIWSF